MVDRTSRPIVPTEHADEREHRRLLAVRASASLPKDGTEGMTAPFRMMQYATADLPPASENAGTLVYVTDGPALAFSNGSAWQTVTATPTERPASIVLNTGTFSAASSVDIDIQPYSAFGQIKLVVSNVTESVANEYFCRVRFSFDGGSTFKSTANDYYYAAYYDYSDASVVWRGDHAETADGLYSAWINNVSGYSGNHELTLHNPYDTVNYKIGKTCSYSLGGAGYYAMYWEDSNVCWYTNAINKIRIFPNSGNFTGRWTLYGIRTQ